MQDLEQVWQFGPKKNDLQGKVPTGGISNGNEEKGYEESCKEEKEVTVLARH
jgi:hypothetical protein